MSCLRADEPALSNPDPQFDIQGPPVAGLFVVNTIIQENKSNRFLIIKSYLFDAHSKAASIVLQ